MSPSNEQIKAQHGLPEFDPYPSRYSTTQLDPAMATPIYNELFRGLAWHGRDTEFLSLWQEARGCMFRILL